MVERPDFLVAYNAVEVPATRVSADAIDEHVYELERCFMGEIRASLDLSDFALEHFFVEERSLLVRPEHAEQGYFDTDDYQLRYRKCGQQILASVTYTRDDFNYQVAHFAKYPLTDHTVESIRELQRIERIVAGLE